MTDSATQFKRGQMLFTKQGVAVIFDHLHEAKAYVATAVRVEYYGDDGNQYEEDYEPSETLFPLGVSELFLSPPIEVIDDEVLAKQEELASVKSSLAEALKKSETERRNANQELLRAKADLEKWNKDHQRFVELGRLLDGTEVFPLNAELNHYHKSHNVPRVPDIKDIEYITISHNSHDKDSPWRVKSRSGGLNYGVRFFDSEADRDAFVSDCFTNACEAFRKAPKYETTSYTSGTTLHFGTLQDWVTRFAFLSIPQDIQEGKIASDGADTLKEKQRLLEQIAELEASP